MPGVIDAIKDANRTRLPEDSIAVRAVILATVITGALALAIVQAISITTTIFVVVALCGAYWVSYIRRRSDNWAIKIALTAAAIVAMLNFFRQLSTVATLDEVRFPLAHLFLWIQVVHGFDLPARKDLNFSLTSSLALMAAAASISQDLWYGGVLIVYLVLAVAALALLHRSAVTEGAITTSPTGPGSDEVRAPRAIARDVFKALAVTVVAGTVLFLVIPQPQAIRTFALPFAIGGGVGIPASGGIANPGFPNGGTPSSRSSNAAYYGFSNRMDLRVRGDLSDDVVMRVRASAPGMLRGMVFEKYDGVAWSADETDPTPLEGDPPYGYPPEFRSLGPRATLTETFYIETEQPNVVFSTGQPDTVWIDGGVSIDQNGGLRTPSTLTPGTVYSVVSTRGAATPSELRALPEEATPEPLDRYLQLPDELPTRVRDLAARITKDAPTRYDKVTAIEGWLARNYHYNIDSPVPPSGRDAVDYFLFDSDVGFCEQFASATAVMMRSLDIPTRVIAGYTPGTRNPFTGYYEVKNSDAHTWVEVWFPKFGWYEFDPTFAIPPAHEDLASNVPLAKAFDFLSEHLKDALPHGMKDFAGTILGAGFFLVLAFGAYLAWRKRNGPREVTPAFQPAVVGGPVTKAFRRFEYALAQSGRARSPNETAAEVLRRTTFRKKTGSPKTALTAFEKERYGADEPTEEEVRSAVAELARLSAEAEDTTTL